MVLCAGAELESIDEEIALLTSDWQIAQANLSNHDSAQQISKAEEERNEALQDLKDIKQRLKNSRLTGRLSYLLQQKH
jgi:hypothetical protein